MGWFRDHLFVISLGAFLLSVLTSALVVSFGGFVVLSALLSGSLPLDVLVGLWPAIPVLAVTLTVAVLSGLGVGWSALSRLSLPSLDGRAVSERIHPIVKTLEQKNSTLASLSLSEYVAPPEPSDEEKVERLKQQYVEGTIDEREFERRVERLTSVDTASVDTDRDRIVERGR
ncbi:SHOCT domain-containing protein [Halocatena pleomorpha]|uniref:SHOCT domain-containing protein n=1 Tax=Halocatena pleomorpha TaxID=1785090 RepID=A0A3P3R6K0_9EURY|nr:SHOCT domain-containing protein [Halocatena pleomorpha]RRJ28193.1 SHOCT domain-containing protein [Halocatena pleomorpha]